MKYINVKKGLFLERPNRFIALVEIEGRKETVHVKNTGRCRELLIPGATVYVEDHAGAMGSRKTRFDLIAVEKRRGENDGAGSETPMLINMDSQAPNKVVGEALKSGALRLPDFPPLTLLRAETVFGESRFDFYAEGTDDSQPERKRAFIEVKGVTLEEEGVARFPDAPTERGVKHIEELCRAKEQGYEAYAIFVVQMRPVFRMEPNDRTHEAFGNALRHAAGRGVHVMAIDCAVEPDSLTAGASIPVRL